MTFQLRNLTYCYEKDKPILRNLCMDIPAGERVAVLGVSGSGKTTLLNILGLLACQCYEPATVFYQDGQSDSDYAKLSSAQQANFRLNHFGFVLQSA